MRNPVNSESIYLADITFVKIVSIGDLNKPTSEEEMMKRVELLNKCLQELPKGRIIGKNVSTQMLQFKDLPGPQERTTYHIGWTRKPYWLEEEEESNST